MREEETGVRIHDTITRMDDETVKLLQEIRSLLRIKICQEELRRYLKPDKGILPTSAIGFTINNGSRIGWIHDAVQTDFQKIANTAYQDMKALGLIN